MKKLTFLFAVLVTGILTSATEAQVRIIACVESYCESSEKILIDPTHSVTQVSYVAILRIIAPTDLKPEYFEVRSRQRIPEEHLLRKIGACVEFDVDEAYVADRRPEPASFHKFLNLQDVSNLSERKEGGEPGATDNPGDAQ